MKDKNNHGFENAMSGWLSPEGEYIACKNGQHVIIAREIEKTKKIPLTWNQSEDIVHGERLLELIGYIKFVCFDWGCDGKNSHVFFPQTFGFKGKISKAQLKWINHNLVTMSSKQETDINNFLQSHNEY